jgi:hypothetical protein
MPAGLSASLQLNVTWYIGHVPRFLEQLGMPHEGSIGVLPIEGEVRIDRCPVLLNHPIRRDLGMNKTCRKRSSH